MSSWKLSSLAIVLATSMFVQVRAQAPGGPARGARGADDPFGPGPAAEGAPAAGEGGMQPGPVPDPMFWYYWVGDSDPDSTVRIEHTLRKQLHNSGLDFTDQPLIDVIEQLQTEYGIPIQLDRKALEAAGLRHDEPVSVNIHNVSLRSALQLMFHNLNLTTMTSDGALMVTTPDAADKSQRICVYSVGTISGPNDSQLSSIVDLITTCVATNSWAENGGTGQIRAIKPGLIVITQNARNHRQINDLIDSIHKMRKAQAAANPEAAAGAVPIGVPFGATPVDVPMEEPEIVTRSYILQLSSSDETTRAQVSDLIRGALPNESWDQAAPPGTPATSLTVLKDRVVVRHTAEVQDKVKKLLSDSGIASQLPVPKENGAGPAAGGFGGISSSGRFSE
jgi:hypothetical protein